MSNAHTPAVTRAEKAWGADLPDWVRVLAEEIDARGSQNQIAKHLGYSAGTVSQIVARKYRGRTDRVEQIVRGLFMGQTVECPVLGEIRRDRCVREQQRPLTFENPIRAKLYDACRGGCPHSHLNPKGAGDDD